MRRIPKPCGPKVELGAEGRKILKSVVELSVGISVRPPGWGLIADTADSAGLLLHELDQHEEYMSDEVAKTREAVRQARTLHALLSGSCDLCGSFVVCWTVPTTRRRCRSGRARCPIC